MSHILNVLHKKWLIILGISLTVFTITINSDSTNLELTKEADNEIITKLTPSSTLTSTPTVYPTITSTRQAEVIAGASGTLQITFNTEPKKEITHTAASTSVYSTVYFGERNINKESGITNKTFTDK